MHAILQGVYKQMVELMKAVGVSAVPGEGSAFDPNVHDAIMREPSADVPDSTVLQVHISCFLSEHQWLMDSVKPQNLLASYLLKRLPYECLYMRSLLVYPDRDRDGREAQVRGAGGKCGTERKTVSTCLI